MYRVLETAPLEPGTRLVLAQVHRVCAALGTAYACIGALARDLLLTHVHGLAVERATRDIDIAIAVQDWTAYDALITALLGEGRAWSQAAGVRHRLVFRGLSSPHGLPLDLLPFGRIEHPPGLVTWPGERATLRVAGLREAVSSAVTVMLDEQVTIKVASLAALMLLKLFAWLDRRQGSTKDGEDMLLLLHTYARAGNVDRLYGPSIGLLTACEFDLSRAGAALLGEDVAAIADHGTRTQLTALIMEGATRDLLVRDLLSAEARGRRLMHERPFTADLLLSHFAHGMTGELSGTESS